MIPVKTIPIVHSFVNDSVADLLVVDQLKSYYNFFTDETFELKSTILSDLKDSIKIPAHTFLNVNQKKKKKRTSLKENAVVTETIKTEFLEAKHTRIKNMIDLKEDFFKEAPSIKK